MVKALRLACTIIELDRTTVSPNSLQARRAAAALLRVTRLLLWNMTYMTAYRNAVPKCKYRWTPLAQAPSNQKWLSQVYASIGNGMNLGDLRRIRRIAYVPIDI